MTFVRRERRERASPSSPKSVVTHPQSHPVTPHHHPSADLPVHSAGARPRGPFPFAFDANAGMAPWRRLSREWSRAVARAAAATGAPPRGVARRAPSALLESGRRVRESDDAGTSLVARAASFHRAASRRSDAVAASRSLSSSARIDATSTASTSRGGLRGVAKPPESHFVDRMSAAASARDHAAVFEIFSEMCEHYPEDPGAEAYDVLLQCASREGDPETALGLIEAMCARGHEPTALTHELVVVAYNRAGDVAKGLEWLVLLSETENEDFMRRDAVGVFDAVLLGAANVADQVRSIHWSPYDIVRVVNADP
jgi:pentatricopeptide repeat protein